MLRQVLERLDDPGGVISRDFDPASARLSILGYELGDEARREAKRILQGKPPRITVHTAPSALDQVRYWTISALGTNQAEVLNLPSTGLTGSLPTAAEITLVRAAHILTPEAVENFIASGGLLTCAQPQANLYGLVDVLSVVRRRGTIQCALIDGNGTIDIEPARAQTPSSSDSLKIFGQAFLAEPFKYHFLEMYRSIEIQMLHELLRELNSTFFDGPKPSVEKARKTLESEITQITKLVVYTASNFEDVFDIVEAADAAGNTFAAAIKEKHRRNAFPGVGKPEQGSVYVYYMRCAIVHAGDKDILYDRYVDGQELLEQILLPLEKAAMEISGIRCP